MKTFSVLLAAASLLVGMATAPAVAGPPPPGGIAAQCSPGFTADPPTYTNAQLNSGRGVKYSCTEFYSKYQKSPFVQKGFKFQCSSNFTTPGATQGADAPRARYGKAVYFCITSAHIR